MSALDSSAGSGVSRDRNEEEILSCSIMQGAVRVELSPSRTLESVVTGRHQPRSSLSPRRTCVSVRPNNFASTFPMRVRLASSLSPEH